MAVLTQFTQACTKEIGGWMWKEELKAPLIGFLVVVIVCALSWIWSRHSEELSRRRQDEAVGVIANDLRETAQHVARAVSARGVVTDWTDAFSGRGFLRDYLLGISHRFSPGKIAGQSSSLVH